MEYVDGGTLSLPADRHRPSTDDRHCAPALRRSSTRRTRRARLHRDLKPANIMLDGRGREDHGLGPAVAAEEGDRRRRSGTPAEMETSSSPESPRPLGVDLYALGRPPRSRDRQARLRCRLA